MRFACIKLRGSIISTTPTFIGGAGENTLKFIPGSFIRGAFGTYMVKRFCIKRRPWRSHGKCEARDGCPYIETFGQGYKSANIIFRYAYPEHQNCKEGGVYIPFRDERSNSHHTSKPRFICSGCGRITDDPIELMEIPVDKLMSNRAFHDDKGVAGFIPPGTRFSFEAVMPPKMKPYAELVKDILVDTMLKMGIGRWKRLGFGRFAAKIETQIVNVEDVIKRGEKLNPSNFTVKLVSPAILGENLLSPSILLESARRAYTRIFHKGKPPLPTISLTSANYSFEPLGGWSLKLEKPRRIRKAISAGSTFNFKCDKSERDLLALALAALEHYAIGEYKPHGCGQIVIESYEQQFSDN